MEIFLVRNAAAEESDEVAEALRPLSTRGRKRMNKAIKGLRRLGVEFDHLFHSPWLSAVQTAEILAPLNGGASATTDLLAAEPGIELANLARQFTLDQSNPDARVALLGHQPWISQLASLLITGETQHADNLPIKRGGVIWLTGVAAPGGAELVAALNLRMLRKLASGSKGKSKADAETGAEGTSKGGSPGSEQGSSKRSSKRSSKKSAKGSSKNKVKVIKFK